MQYNDPFEPKETRPLGERKQISETLQSVCNTGVTMLVAVAVLFVFNSSGLRTWTRNLDGNTMTDRWVAEADNWHDLMARLGFASPKSAVQTAVNDMREWSWSSDDSETDVAVNFDDEADDFNDDETTSVHPQ